MSLKKKVAIVQSNYLPWKGYFDLIDTVDEFVLLDDVQFTKRDWRNRNQIKSPSGLIWLTVPVKSKGRFSQPINETEIDYSRNWQIEHWKSIELNYRRAPFFGWVESWLRYPLLSSTFRTVSDLNEALLKLICSKVGVQTTITRSSAYPTAADRSQRLLEICAASGASEYLSGPAAAVYLDTELFETRGIHVNWFSYDRYPEYPQLWGGFVHQVSVLDLLLNCGPSSYKHIKKLCIANNSSF
jgi:hypothetical protein